MRGVLKVFAPPEDKRVREAIVRFAREQERERLRLYRMHLQSSVTAMNRLACDIAAIGGMSPGDVARGLRPPFDWPWRSLGPGVPGDWSVAAHALRHAAVRLTSDHRARRGKGMVRSPSLSNGSDACAFLAMSGCLEVQGAIGSASLTTLGDRASLELPDDLPETILAAMPGRPIGDLVDHPLLVGRNYVVETVRHVHWASVEVTFVTGVVPVSMPWPRLLSEAHK